MTGPIGVLHRVCGLAWGAGEDFGDVFLPEGTHLMCLEELRDGSVLVTDGHRRYNVRLKDLVPVSGADSYIDGTVRK